MANVKKGQLVRAPEWAKHLRPYGKRVFWKRERAAERRYVSCENTMGGGRHNKA